jgi:hypothetical protein
MRGIERPPRWAFVALILFALADIVLVAQLALRSPASATATATASRTGSAPATSAAPETSSAVAAGSTAPSATPPLLAVYGDGYSAGNDVGGQGPTGWPALVAQRTGAQLTLTAVPQAGYSASGVDGRTYLTMVNGAPVPDADVTVVLGSRNDQPEDPAAVGTAALATFRQILLQAPETTLVVVGPVWSDDAPPAALGDVRDAVAAAAAQAGAQFVDALAEEWFAEPEGLIGLDGISPTDAGHAHLADLVTPLVSQALTRTDATD